MSTNSDRLRPSSTSRALASLGVHPWRLAMRFKRVLPAAGSRMLMTTDRLVPGAGPRVHREPNFSSQTMPLAAIHTPWLEIANCRMTDFLARPLFPLYLYKDRHEQPKTT